MWWVLIALIVCPFGVWALIRSTGPEDPANVHVGQVLKLDRTGVALTKPVLEALIRASRTNNRFGLSRLVSTGQVLTPQVGTQVKIVYIELFRDITIFQVSILNGKYQGRTGWVTEEQIHWDTPRAPKNVLPDDDDTPLNIPLGVGPDSDPGSGGDANPDK
jgi:hypothetical protein